jgi:hypothetical protein
LLLADARVIRVWRGCHEGSRDYERACEAIGDADASPIAIGSAFGLLWHMGGPGTTHVFQVGDSGLVLSRGWFPTATPGDDFIASVASLPRASASKYLGEVEIDSGTLAILWAPKDGADGTALLLAVRAGRYRCTQDEVTLEAAEGLRCHVDFSSDPR